MNLNQIESFIEAVKQGSLNKASQKLYLSQSAVIRQIQRLEQEMNCRLINRDTSKFVLTAEGKRFLRSAEYIYQEYKTLFSDIARMHQVITGSLYLISTAIIAEFVLPALLHEFKLKYPFIDINVTVVDLGQVIEGVSRGNAPLGFFGSLARKGKNPFKRDDIELIKIGEDDEVFITYPGHPLTLKKEITLSDIIGEPIILKHIPRSDDYGRIGVDFANYQPKVITGTLGGVLAAVEAKLGIGLIPSLAITKSEALGLIKVLRVKNFKINRDLYCVYRKDDLTTKLTQNFVEFIKYYTKEKSPLP